MLLTTALNHISESEASSIPDESRDVEDCVSDIQLDAVYSRSPHNAKKIQVTCINYIRKRFGDRFPDAIDGSKRRVSLEAILEETRRKFAPSVSNRTLRRWVYHHFAHGGSPILHAY